MSLILPFHTLYSLSLYTHTVGQNDSSTAYQIYIKPSIHVRYLYNGTEQVCDDVTYVYVDVTYVYDDLTYTCATCTTGLSRCVMM